MSAPDTQALLEEAEKLRDGFDALTERLAEGHTVMCGVYLSAGVCDCGYDRAVVDITDLGADGGRSLTSLPLPCPRDFDRTNVPNVRGLVLPFSGRSPGAGPVGQVGLVLLRRVPRQRTYSSPPSEARMRTPQCLLRLHSRCPSSWPTMDVGVGFTGFEHCPCPCHDDEEPRRNALFGNLATIAEPPSDHA